MHLVAICAVWRQRQAGPAYPWRMDRWFNPVAALPEAWSHDASGALSQRGSEMQKSPEQALRARDMQTAAAAGRLAGPRQSSLIGLRPVEDLTFSRLAIIIASSSLLSSYVRRTVAEALSSLSTADSCAHGRNLHVCQAGTTGPRGQHVTYSALSTRDWSSVARAARTISSSV